MKENSDFVIEKKWKPTWFDFFLLFLLVLAVGALSLFIWRSATDNSADVRIYYTLSFAIDEKYSETISSYMPIGSSVRSANGTAVLGQVTAMSLMPQYIMTVRNGEVVTDVVPEQLRVITEVVADGKLRPGEGARVCDIRIAAGGNGDWRIGSFFATNARVVSMNWEALE